MFNKGNDKIIESIECLTKAIERNNELKEREIKAMQSMANSLEGMRQSVTGDYGKKFHVIVDSRY